MNNKTQNQVVIYDQQLNMVYDSTYDIRNEHQKEMQYWLKSSILFLKVGNTKYYRVV